MKKLIMAAATVCAAVIANAGSFDWNVTGYFYWNDEGATGAELAGSSIYLFQGGSSEMAVVLSSLGTSGLSALDGNLGSGDVGMDGLVSFSNEAGKKQISDDGGTPTAYVNGFLIAVTKDEKFATGMAYPALTAGEGLKATGANFMPDWAVEMPAAGAAGWATVAPEPTSGLLLLIGVAGLALRRRRA